MKNIFTAILITFIFTACKDNDDTPVPKDLEVHNFIWKGLNLYYLWQDIQPNLADDKFANQKELNDFLSKYSTPEELFENLRVDKTIDRFSWIVDDYEELEGSLQGTNLSDGIDYGLSYESSASDKIFGFVRYIVPNSDADNKGLKRGDIFYAINGTQLTDSNYHDLLLNSTSYTLNMADLINSRIVPNAKSFNLTKTTLSENPILINKVINSGDKKIGYLLYNGFYAKYDQDLNTAFGQLKAQGITDFVLDLRYNPGGSVQTATRLASMITGQFTDQLFAKEQWNSKLQEYFEKNTPGYLSNNFVSKIDGASINSLNLTKIYIITSKSTASASELVINGLKPYIDVVQIGDVTIGKNVASVTLYDTPDFQKSNGKPKSNYAMQPIVLKTTNADGFGEYANGLYPDITIKENLSNLGVLGENSEPLLQKAIERITGVAARKIEEIPINEFQYYQDVKSIKGLNRMYIENLPK